jgi:uncharacterized membrane protein (DUF485 family)
MSTVLFGNFNVGFVFGLLQFVSTFTIAVLYSRYANRRLDPIADRIRGEMEGRRRDEYGRGQRSHRRERR